MVLMMGLKVIIWPSDDQLQMPDAHPRAKTDALPCLIEPHPELDVLVNLALAPTSV